VILVDDDCLAETMLQLDLLVECRVRLGQKARRLKALLSSASKALYLLGRFVKTGMVVLVSDRDYVKYDLTNIPCLLI